MSILFTAASNQAITNATTSGLPSTGYPFSVGLWCRLTAVSNTVRILWGITDTGSTNNYLQIGMTSGELIAIYSAAGGAEASGTISTAINAGTWVYVVGRFISSTNRRIARILDTGAIGHGYNTTDHAPTGLDQLNLGRRNTSAGADRYWDGNIAEYWLANIDIQGDGGQLDNSMLSTLAYDGPFSIPHVAANLLEYRALKKHITSGEDDYFNVKIGGAGQQTWTKVNTPTIGPHPPLRYSYRRPPLYGVPIGVVPI